MPHSTCWSVDAYDAATNNFFARDDRELAGDAIEIVALRPGAAGSPRDGVSERIVLVAPTTKGILLLRLLVNDNSEVPRPDAIRRQASCATVASQ